MTRIGLCQYSPVAGNREKNVELSLKWIEKAASENAKLVVLPELVTSGYGLEHKLILKLAEKVPGRVTELWSKKAKEHGIYIIGGMPTLHPSVAGVVYNSAVVINPKGDIQSVYNKISLPLYLHTRPETVLEEKETFTPGNEVKVVDTELGKIAPMICYDMCFPELARLAVLKGAEIIIYLFCSGLFWEETLPILGRALALFNGSYIIAANRVGKDEYRFRDQIVAPEFHGGSYVIDPSGKLVVRGKLREEDLIMADIDSSHVAEARWTVKLLRDYLDIRQRVPF